MARAPRLNIPGLLYHVICRGNQKQRVFIEDSDFRAYLLRLAETHQILPFRLYAYALMGNHVHLLVEAGEAPLSKVMQTVQQRYTQYFNMKYNKIGHTFQGRYKAIICQKDAYLLELVRYIHLNPVRAGIVSGPDDYPWTSHRAFMATKADPWLDRDAILMQFGKESGQAKEGYMNFLMGGLNEGHRDDLYELKEQQVLGSDEFLDTLPLSATKVREDSEIDEKLLKKLEKIVCDAFKVNAEDLQRPGAREVGLSKATLCILAQKRGIPLLDVANSLGVTINSLRQTLNRHRTAATSHPAHASLISLAHDA